MTDPSASKAAPRMPTDVLFEAQYFDGNSSHSCTVLVHSEGADALLLKGEGVERRVPVHEIRFSSRLGYTPRSLMFIDGAKCETSDNDAVDRLAQRWGKGRPFALVHALESHWKHSVVALGLLVVLIGGGFRWGIPLFAKGAARLVPKEAAYDLGRGTLKTLDQLLFEPAELDPKVQARLRTAFGRMAQAYPELPLVLHFRNAHMPNAFALPDGSVIVTDELVLLAERDEEVLAVLAHEIGHVHHRHALRLLLETSSMALLLSAYLGDATQISSLLATLPTAYTQANFSQAHEAEADEFALSFLHRTGIARKNFASILRKLQAQSGQKDAEKSVLRYLASHPSTEQRIKKFTDP